MALQASGPLWFSEISGEMGGGNPVWLSNYYKGGVNVPATRVVAYWGTEVYSDVSAISFYSSAPSNIILYTNNVDIINVDSAEPTPYQTIYTAPNGVRYRTGNLNYTSATTKRYGYQIEAFRTDAINPSIPTSGQISLGQFYGGTNT